MKKVIIMKTIMMITSIIPAMKTPMSLGILLLLQTLMSTFLVNMMGSSWMAMVMFLMLIGGLLIIFMYMSSIACNEKFKANYKMMILLIIMMMPMEEMITENQLNETQLEMMNTESMTFMKIYNKKSFMITIMVFIYMFFSMVVVTQIVKIYKGPLRSKYE